MKIYCCVCQSETDAQMVTGAVVYPHRGDLAKLPFWQCPCCKNFVGCHHKRKDNPFAPLGVIAGQELKKARMDLHAMLDPLWRNNVIGRKKLYKLISDFLGYEYHTGETRSLEEIAKVKGFLLDNFKNKDK